MGACVSSDSRNTRQAHVSAATSPSHPRATERIGSEPAHTGSMANHSLHATQQAVPGKVTPEKELLSAANFGQSAAVHEVEQPQTPDQGEVLSTPKPLQKGLLQQQLLDTLSDWQEQHDNQRTELTNQVLLQSQEISKLRDQVIDLQAFRQHQQRQQQRAAYIKSKIFPKYEEQGLDVPSDCCAAAMACCLAIEELKNDLKIEGQIISKQFEALLLLRSQKNGSFLAKKYGGESVENVSQSSTASPCICTHDASD